MSYTIPPNTKKVLFIETNEETKIKKQKQNFCALYNGKQLEDKQNYNTYLFKIDKDFIIIDIDGEHAYKYVRKLLKKHNVDKYQRTKSISNINNINMYKYHYYFNNNLNIQNNRSIGQLELFVDKLLFEDTEQFNNKINLNDLPDINMDFYNDLLKYVKPQENKNDNEIPKGPKDEIIKKTMQDDKIIKETMKDDNYNDDFIDDEEITTTTTENKPHKIPKKPKDEVINNTNNIDDKELKIMELVDILDTWRANDYNQWYTVGQALCNIDNEYINIYDSFSKKAINKYNIKDINNKWIEFKKPKSKDKKKLSLGTLRKYANEDNHDLYVLWCKKWKQTEIYLYNEIKENFEIKNFKINNPCMYATINYENELIIRDRREFMNLYENLTYSSYNAETGQIVSVGFISDWLKDINIRTYEKMDFLPMQTAPNNIFNVFDGYNVLKTNTSNNDDDDLNFENSLIFKHLKNLCNNDENVIDYVIKFLARKIKHPYKNTNTALIFKSKPGAGKNIFFDWLGDVIIGSKYYLDTEKPELLFGRFTSLLENKILVVVNETSGKDTFNLNENIKAAITAKENIIEHKGLKPYKNNNNVGYIFLTNNDNPIKIPHDDRRFCGIECNNGICNNAVYFKNLIDEMNSGKYNKIMYDYLLNIDCENYDFTNNRPITSFYEDMKEMNTPLIVKFFRHILLCGDEKYFGAALFKEFNDFIKANNYKCEYTTTKFGVDVKKFKGINKKKSNFIEYIIDRKELKKYLIDEYKMEFVEEENEPNEPYIKNEKKKINNIEYVQKKEFEEEEPSTYRSINRLLNQFDNDDDFIDE